MKKDFNYLNRIKDSIESAMEYIYSIKKNTSDAQSLREVTHAIESFKHIVINEIPEIEKLYQQLFMEEKPQGAVLLDEKLIDYMYEGFCLRKCIFNTDDKHALFYKNGWKDCVWIMMDSDQRKRLISDVDGSQVCEKS